MAVIAPWLRGADVIGSASAGANVGLAARARDLQAAAQQQAADEFIARLNQQAYQFDRNLASEHDIAASRLAQALREQDALDVYRKGELKVRNREADTHAAKLLAENSFIPQEMTTAGGTRLMQTSRGQYRLLDDDSLTGTEVEIGGHKYVYTGPKHLERVKEEQDKRTPSQWNAHIANLNKQLEATGLSDEDKANLGLQLKTAQEKQRELMTPGLPRAVITPEIPSKWNLLSPGVPATPAIPAKTNWVSTTQPTNAPAALAPAEEKVVVIKDGKRYRLPKSQLDEAKNEGYELER